MCYKIIVYLSYTTYTNNHINFTYFAMKVFSVQYYV